MSVSELSGSLKRTLEETYGRIRVRGELSRVSIPGSGHMYSDLKDENSLINVVCWKGVLSKLSIRPEEGMEVVCTGRISTYPSRSNYQLIIEKMELAGEGALLKLLEDRKKKLAAEGLFAQELKKPLPFIPQTIGVITSPTGAVIRDIMHRLKDRFPRHVLVWPVLVQGEGAAEQIAKAIRGFDAIDPLLGKDLQTIGGVRRPDLLIVARGGGSLEDLMAFNEEVVVRAAAECRIPLISAVGHETDTTLIDYVSDRRAPTPTGAAEIAVPRRIDLLAQVMENGQRLMNASARIVSAHIERVENLSKRLGDPQRLVEMQNQKLDHLSHKLGSVFERQITQKSNAVGKLSSGLKDPAHMLAQKKHRLDMNEARMRSLFDSRLARARETLSVKAAGLRKPDFIMQKNRKELQYYETRLVQLKDKIIDPYEKRLREAGRMLESLSHQKVLERGFAVIRDTDNNVITKPDALRAGQGINLEFAGDKRIGAHIDGNLGGSRKDNLSGAIDKPDGSTGHTTSGSYKAALPESSAKSGRKSATQTKTAQSKGSDNTGNNQGKLF